MISQLMLATALMSFAGQYSQTSTQRNSGFVVRGSTPAQVVDVRLQPRIDSCGLVERKTDEIKLDQDLEKGILKCEAKYLIDGYSVLGLIDDNRRTNLVIAEVTNPGSIYFKIPPSTTSAPFEITLATRKNDQHIILTYFSRVSIEAPLVYQVRSSLQHELRGLAPIDVQLVVTPAAQ